MDSDKGGEITPLETVNYLMTRIRGMLDILSDRQIADLSWPQVLLEIMLDREEKRGRSSFWGRFGARPVFYVEAARFVGAGRDSLRKHLRWGGL
jgi:hypothetical protein